MASAALVLLGSVVAAAEPGPGITIRLLIAKELPSVEIRGLDLVVLDADTAMEQMVNSSGQVRVVAESGKIVLEGRKLPGARLVVRSPAVFVSVNGDEYRSPIELRATGKTLMAISYLDLEAYLPGILAGEMPGYWPLEALKAQVVVARSYAWSQAAASVGKPFDLVTDVRSQVYDGADADTVIMAQAARLTRGIVLAKEGQVVKAFYHSTCGGLTEQASKVWPDVSWPFPVVECTWCKASPSFQWNVKLLPEEVARALRRIGFKDSSVERFDVLKRSASGRVVQIEVSGPTSKVRLDGDSFRQLIGYNVVKSTRFVVIETEPRIHLKGEGFGHGVGMCQWGARGMALEGRSAEEILAHYYPGAQLLELEIRGTSQN